MAVGRLRLAPEDWPYLLLFWPLFRLILEAIALLSHGLSELFYGRPGPLSDMSIVLILLRRRRNRRACEAARARMTPHPDSKTVPAVVTAKRVKEKYYHGEKRPVLRYHAAFRLADGQELWLSLCESEYHQLMEGDQGALTIQEKRYLGFEKSQAPDTPLEADR